MKKIFIAVCVVLCGVAMTSCVDDASVRYVYSLKLSYENKIRAYERLDSTISKYTRDARLKECELARKEYLEAFSELNEKERAAYKTLESDCKSADKDYLGSIYDEDTVDTKEWHQINATYTRAME